MILPYQAAVWGTAALSRRQCNESDAAGSTVLMTTTGKIILANYDGASFTTTLNESITGAPTWVEFVEPNLLYAVDEWDVGMRLFNLDIAGDGSASLSGPVAEANGSSGVVHLEFSQDGSRMVGAAYGGGSIDVWDVSGGQLNLVKTIASEGELGPVKPNQAAPHPHEAVLDPSGRYFVVNDLGTDELLVIDSQDDAFDLVDSVKVEPAGCGPRHGVFYPADAAEATHYIVVCELANLVNVYELSYGADALTFTEVQSVSTFESGTAPEGAAAGEIVLSPSGTDLYVSNRLVGGASDTLAHFSVDAAELTLVSEVPSGGVLPRMFSLGLDGTELFVGNQNGPIGVAAFDINEDGSIAAEPKATLDVGLFGGEGFGPPYIKQIR